VKKIKKCRPFKKTKIRHRLNLAIDKELWDKFQPILSEIWKGSFTSWVEFAMECYSRDSCEGCIYNEPDFKKEKGSGEKFKKK